MTRCNHVDCAKIWYPDLPYITCFRASAYEKPSCFHNHPHQVWAVVKRREKPVSTYGKHLLNNRGKLERVFFPKGNQHPTIIGPPVFTYKDTFDALNNLRYGNELWRAVLCQTHRTPDDGYSKCLVLANRIKMQGINSIQIDIVTRLLALSADKSRYQDFIPKLVNNLLHHKGSKDLMREVENLYDTSEPGTFDRGMASVLRHFCNYFSDGIKKPFDGRFACINELVFTASVMHPPLVHILNRDGVSLLTEKTSRSVFCESLVRLLSTLKDIPAAVLEA